MNLWRIWASCFFRPGAHSEDVMSPWWSDVVVMDGPLRRIEEEEGEEKEEKDVSNGSDIIISDGDDASLARGGGRFCCNDWCV